VGGEKYKVTGTVSSGGCSGFPGRVGGGGGQNRDTLPPKKGFLGGGGAEG